jgi:microcystin-dependent protein
MEPYLATIMMVGFNFPPKGWALCDGQLLPINQYQSLYSLLGTTYGGDGKTTFALPDLRGRTPLHVGDGKPLGQKVGEEKHSLSTQEIPQHTHNLVASSAAADFPIPTNNLLANSAPTELYHAPANLQAANSGSVASVGSGAGHENMQPFLTINFCIALQGVFPPRNIFAGNFAPRGWAFCDGQLLQISQNDALFSLLGTTYGGDGRTTFGLPDLRGRIPIHMGDGPGLTNRPLGSKGGQETVTVNSNELPTHTHPLQVTDDLGNSANPGTNVLAKATTFDSYINENPASTMAPNAITSTGGSHAHDNIQPFLCLHFIISLFGIYPSRN